MMKERKQKYIMTKYYESLSYPELEKQAEQDYKDDKLVSALILYAQMIKKAFCQKTN